MAVHGRCVCVLVEWVGRKSYVCANRSMRWQYMGGVCVLVEWDGRKSYVCVLIEVWDGLTWEVCVLVEWDGHKSYVYHHMCIISVHGRWEKKHNEGWEPEGRKWHFTNFTGEQKQNFTIVWSDFVYRFQLFIIQMCTLMDDSTFASRKSSLRAIIWCIYLHFTKNVT